MSLNLYRRHYRKPGKCAGGHQPDSRSYEDEERRKGRRRCSCPIYADGTLAGQFKRKNTGRNSWDQARTVAAAWSDSGSWNHEAPVVAQAPPVAPSVFPPGRVTVSLDRAVSAFMEEHEEYSSKNTVRKYRLVLKKLVAFASLRGYVLVDQFRPIDVRELRQSWNVSPLTASKNMSVVKSFFEFALVNEWVDSNPARLVKAPRGQSGRAGGRERLPFSDDELERMFAACRSLYAKKQPGRYRWTGADLEDFIAVSVYTGLRISDVSQFHIDRLRPTGECHIRTTKNGRKVFTWAPEWLRQRLRERAARVGPLVFGAHETDDINVITDLWRRKLKRLWALCGPWNEPPTPHRFRHTFARILLERTGVTVRDVAELLGDTEEMVRRHYAAWVPERQERLTAVLKEAFREKPTPKVIAIR